MLIVAAAAIIALGIAYGPAAAAIGAVAGVAILLDASLSRLRDIDHAYAEGVADGRADTPKQR